MAQCPGGVGCGADATRLIDNEAGGDEDDDEDMDDFIVKEEEAEEGQAGGSGEGEWRAKLHEVLGQLVARTPLEAHLMDHDGRCGSIHGHRRCIHGHRGCIHSHRGWIHTIKSEP